jgi:hypothetical protein
MKRPLTVCPAASRVKIAARYKKPPAPVLSKTWRSRRFLWSQKWVPCYETAPALPSRHARARQRRQSCFRLSRSAQGGVFEQSLSFDIVSRDEKRRRHLSRVPCRLPADRACLEGWSQGRVSLPALPPRARGFRWLDRHCLSPDGGAGEAVRVERATNAYKLPSTRRAASW